jgi:hypothetical protein
MGTATFYFKSNSTPLTIHLEELTLSQFNGEVTKLEWTRTDTRLMFLSLEDIIAVTWVPDVPYDKDEKG